MMEDGGRIVIVLGERSERGSFSSSTKLTGEIEDENENDDEDDSSANRGCARAFGGRAIRLHSGPRRAMDGLCNATS